MDKVSVDFLCEICIMTLPVKRRKNIRFYFMTNYFKDLVSGYNQASSNVVKNTIYDAMVKYAGEYHPGYVCYDMDMYVALYKYATTSDQRKHALNEIYGIIDDDFIGHRELIDNFKEFISMKEFLNGENKTEFDFLCMTELDFFKKALKWSLDQAKCGQADFYPDVPVSETEGELKKIAELIVSTGMSDLESYHEALEVLKEWFISREYISRLFLKWKSPWKFDKNKIIYIIYL